MALNFQKRGVKLYKDGFKFKILPKRLSEPLSVKNPTMFFVNSMSDIFHEDMPFSFVDEIIKVIKVSSNHQFWFLTKRPHIMKEYFKNRKVPKNLWIGTTVECKEKIYRIDILREIDAEIKWLSCEPLLEDLGELNLNSINWVAAGGEHGKEARAMKKEWILSLKNECKDQSVAFYFMGWGSIDENGKWRNRANELKTLDGVRYREFPKIKERQGSLFDF